MAELVRNGKYTVTFYDEKSSSMIENFHSENSKEHLALLIKLKRDDGKIYEDQSEMRDLRDEILALAKDIEYVSITPHS